MNGNGDPLEQLSAAGGAVDLSAQAIAVSTQIISAPIRTEAAVGPDGLLELTLLLVEGGEPIARTYRIAGPGRESIRAALAKLDGVGD